MKRRISRLTALLLAVLLLFGAGSVSALAAEEGTAASGCRLGTHTSEMISGGGRQVRTALGVFYVDDENGYIYNASASDKRPVYAHAAARLNWWDGKLFFARLGEDSFDLCSLEPGSGREELLLEGVSGKPGQLYVVDGRTLQFSVGSSVSELDLRSGEVRELCVRRGLFSFAPTGCGPVCAVGSLFDYDLYLNDVLLAEHVEDYRVEYSGEKALLICCAGGAELQMDLDSALRGEPVLSAYRGVFDENDQADFGLEPDSHVGLTLSEYDRENLRAQASGEINPEYLPRLRDGLPRRELSQGVQNTVKRARQMTNIEWIPQKEIKGWWYSANGVKYTAGVKYTGLPYGQPLTGKYVPWSASLETFLAAVNDPSSVMYTKTGDNGAKSGPYYAIDCSAFVSWAWNMSRLKTCDGLRSTANSTKIGSSYSLVEVGDALVNRYHTVLVTDVTYNPDGTIASVELSEANVSQTSSFCCHSWRYTGADRLAQLETYYFRNNGYSVYRSLIRDNASYTHSCAVPLPGDVCPLCGAGMVGLAGVDVSYWQGEIDWDTAAQNLSFAIIRAGYGSGGVDSYFNANASGCEENQLPYGAYLYAKACSVDEAVEEADHILAILTENGHIPDLPVFYDVEYEPMMQLSNEALLQVVSAFCQTIEDAGFRAGVYASKSVWDSRLTDPAYNAWVRWVAQWQSRNMTASGGANVWQYSSTGHVDGINGNVDLDYWLGPVGSDEHRYRVETADPNCTEDGYIKYVCVECGSTVTKHIPATGHSYSSVQTVAPTCTQPGEMTYTCTVCGYVCVEQIPALGHKYQKTQTVAPTCTEPGVLKYSCTVCGYSYTEPVAALGHLFVDGFCTRCGIPETVFDRFEDLDPGRWYSDAVEFCILNHLFNGVTDTRFEPQSPMTRAMTVTVLYRVAGEPDVEGSAPFTDVPASQYYAKPVAWAYQNGIAEGTGDGVFSPKENVTRQQMAAFLYRFAASKGLDVSARADLETFPDWESTSIYAREPLAWTVAVGLIQGSGENGQVLLLPRANATRAQVAVIMQRLCLLLQENGLWTPAE